MINLLPPEINEKRRLGPKIIGLTVLYAFVALIIVGGVFGLMFYNSSTANKITEKETALSNLKNVKSDASDITKQAAFIEDRLNMSTTTKDSKDMVAILQALGGVTPTNVQVDSLKVTVSKDGKSIDFNITGKTPDRRAIILFRDKMTSNASFTNPTITAITEKTTGSDKYGFNITVTYKEKS